MAEPAGRVDARREPEADGALVDGRRIDVRDLHERAQAGLLRPRERAQTGAGEARGSRRRAERRRRSSRARSDPGARRSRTPSASASFATTPVPHSSGNGYSDGRVATTGQSGSRLAGPVVVGDDDVESARLRARDLLDGRDPAVDGQHESAAVVGEPVERLAGEAVTLVEPARQVPVGVGAEAPQAAAARAPSRRCRRRRSRRGRRSACPPRSRRGSSRPLRPCRRAGTGRARAEPPARKVLAARGRRSPSGRGRSP